MENSNSTNELLIEINMLRNNLILIGRLKGLSHPETLRCSQELDDLIYKFQKSINTTRSFTQ